MLHSLLSRALIILSFVSMPVVAQGPSIACIQDPDAKPGTDCRITVRSGVEPLLLRIEDGGPVKDAKVTVKGPQALNTWTTTAT